MPTSPANPDPPAAVTFHSLRDVFPAPLLAELRLIADVCSVPGHIPDVLSTLYVTAPKWALKAFSEATKRLRDLAEDLLEMPAELVVEGSTVSVWCEGSFICAHRDNGVPVGSADVNDDRLVSKSTAAKKSYKTPYTGIPGNPALRKRHVTCTVWLNGGGESERIQTASSDSTPAGPAFEGGEFFFQAERSPSDRTKTRLPDSESNGNRKKTILAPSTNQGVIFDSNIVHGVLPVKSGKRYSLLVWLSQDLDAMQDRKLRDVHGEEDVSGPTAVSTKDDDPERIFGFGPQAASGWDFQGTTHDEAKRAAEIGEAWERYCEARGKISNEFDDIDDSSSRSSYDCDERAAKRRKMNGNADDDHRNDISPTVEIPKGFLELIESRMAHYHKHFASKIKARQELPCDY